MLYAVFFFLFFVFFGWGGGGGWGGEKISLWLESYLLPP